MSGGGAPAVVRSGADTTRSAVWAGAGGVRGGGPREGCGFGGLPVKNGGGFVRAPSPATVDENVAPTQSSVSVSTREDATAAPVRSAAMTPRATRATRAGA